jgi:hypothetical protein
MLHPKERYMFIKFQSKYHESFLLGYSFNSKAYRVYNRSSGLVQETSDVEFDGD